MANIHTKDLNIFNKFGMNLPLIYQYRNIDEVNGLLRINSKENNLVSRDFMNLFPQSFMGQIFFNFLLLISKEGYISLYGISDNSTFINDSPATQILFALEEDFDNEKVLAYKPFPKFSNNQEGGMCFHIDSKNLHLIDDLNIRTKDLIIATDLKSPENSKCFPGCYLIFDLNRYNIHESKSYLSYGYLDHSYAHKDVLYYKNKKRRSFIELGFKDIDLDISISRSPKLNVCH